MDTDMLCEAQDWVGGERQAMVLKGILRGFDEPKIAQKIRISVGAVRKLKRVLADKGFLKRVKKGNLMRFVVADIGPSFRRFILSVPFERVIRSAEQSRLLGLKQREKIVSAWIREGGQTCACGQFQHPESKRTCETCGNLICRDCSWDEKTCRICGWKKCGVKV